MTTAEATPIKAALADEIRSAEEAAKFVAQIRVHRSAPEGVVVATPLTQPQAVWLLERKLILPEWLEGEQVNALREVVLYPADWAKLHAELVADAVEYGAEGSGYRRGSAKAQGAQTVTRVFGVPVITFLR